MIYDVLYVLRAEQRDNNPDHSGDLIIGFRNRVAIDRISHSEYLLLIRWSLFCTVQINGFGYTKQKDIL